MKNKKPLLMIIAIILCLAAAGYGYWRYDVHRKDEARKEAEEALSVSFRKQEDLPEGLKDHSPYFNGNTLFLEYGKGTLDANDLIEGYEAETLRIEPESIDLLKTGTTQIHYTVTSHDTYSKEVSKEFTYDVVVADRKAPDIQIDDIWKYYRTDDDIDLTAFVTSVYDPVDGELEYSEEPANGFYTIDRSQYIEDANGTYYLSVIAQDANGNKSFNGFKITLVGGRDQTEEEVQRLAQTREEYLHTESDDDLLLKYYTPSGDIIDDPEKLNGIWNSLRDSEETYMGFRIEYPRVLSWGPLEANITEAEDLENTYIFKFDEGTDQETWIFFELLEEDSGVLYYVDESNQRVNMKVLYRLNDDLTVREQTTKKRAMERVEVTASYVIDNEVTEIERENRRREEARRRAEEAKAAQAQQAYAQASQPSSVDTAGYRSQVVDIINQERAANGLGGLTVSDELNAAAQRRAEEISSFYSHNRPDGSLCFSIFQEMGVPYDPAGENIAAGQRSPAEVMNGWMNSDGHRANILNGSATRVGVGCVYIPGSQYGFYWVQLFAY